MTSGTFIYDAWVLPVITGISLTKSHASRSRFRNTHNSSPPIPQPKNLRSSSDCSEAPLPTGVRPPAARWPYRSCSHRACGIWSGTPTATTSPRSGRRTPSLSPPSAPPTSRSSSRVTCRRLLHFSNRAHFLFRSGVAPILRSYVDFGFAFAFRTLPAENSTGIGSCWSVVLIGDSDLDG